MPRGRGEEANFLSWNDGNMINTMRGMQTGEDEYLLATKGLTIGRGAARQTDTDRPVQTHKHKRTHTRTRATHTHTHVHVRAC